MQCDSSVPIPKTRNRWIPLFEKLEVGDSFVIEDFEEVERVCNAAYAYGKSHGNGFRLTRRKIEEGYRIWRVK